LVQRSNLRPGGSLTEESWRTDGRFTAATCSPKPPSCPSGG